MTEDKTNVTKLRGLPPVAPEAPVVCADLVDLLTGLLDDAKAGRVTALAGIGQKGADLVLMHVGLLTPHDCLAMIGMLEILKNQLMEDAIVGGA